MRRAKERSFDKYNDMASNGWQSIMALKDLREDLLTVVMAHSELDSTGFARLKTVGKLSDSGAVSVVHHASYGVMDVKKRLTNYRRNNAGQWRAANDARLQAGTPSARPLHQPGYLRIFQQTYCLWENASSIFRAG